MRSHATGAHVIAVDVETQDQLAALGALGVNSASGYLLARAAPPQHLSLPGYRAPLSRAAPGPCTPDCSISWASSPLPETDRAKPVDRFGEAGVGHSAATS